MEDEHLDRQPPRDAEEEREQDRLIEESGTETELPTEAPAADVE